jgi:hypothetical protein
MKTSKRNDSPKAVALYVELYANSSNVPVFNEILLAIRKEKDKLTTDNKEVD